MTTERLQVSRGVVLKTVSWALVVFSLFVLAADRRAEGGTVPVELRGAWVQARDLKVKDRIDKIFDRCRRAHLNSLYCLVFHGLEYDFVGEDGFDGLDYICKKAHAEGMQIHAWFVNAHAAYWKRKWTDFMREHENWFCQTLQGIRHGCYINLAHPGAGRHQVSKFVELVRKYPIDGVHFDYIRWERGTGDDICHCRSCSRKLRAKYGFGTRDVIYKDLPARGWFEGNPVRRATTAAVVAEFENGTPMATINKIGRGEVVLMNYQAMSKCAVAAGDYMMTNLLDKWTGRGGKVYALRYKKWGGYLAIIDRWLDSRGYKMEEVADNRVLSLDLRFPIVWGGVYGVDAEFLKNMKEWVSRGGHLLIVDAPVWAIRDEPLARELIGVGKDYNWWSKYMTVRPVGKHWWVPVSKTRKKIDPKFEKKREQWRRFREDQVSDFVKAVYKAVKAVRKDCLVTAAVVRSVEGGHWCLQDWSRWIKQPGFVDYVIPMHYTRNSAEYRKICREWREEGLPMDRIIYGLGMFAGKGADTLIERINIARAEGAKGMCIFQVSEMPDELCDELGRTLFRQKAKPWRPGM